MQSQSSSLPEGSRGLLVSMSLSGARLPLLPPADVVRSSTRTESEVGRRAKYKSGPPPRPDTCHREDLQPRVIDMFP
jgi:hypothetical protein